MECCEYCDPDANDLAIMLTIIIIVLIIAILPIVLSNINGDEWDFVQWMMMLLIIGFLFILPLMMGTHLSWILPIIYVIVFLLFLGLNSTITVTKSGRDTVSRNVL